MDKKTLRKKYLSQRMALIDSDWELRSRQICEHLLRFCLENTRSSQVFLFYAIHKEPPVQNIAESLWDRFDFALPRVLGSKMEFRRWERKTQLQISSFKIQEPPPNAQLANANEQTILVVPNLAMDKEGYRLGYGAGYYDKFLEEHPNLISIGVNFSEFVVEELPREAWDRPLKWMCTEKGVERVKA